MSTVRSITAWDLADTKHKLRARVTGGRRRLRVTLISGVVGFALLFGGLPTATGAEDPTPATRTGAESGYSQYAAGVVAAADAFDAIDPVTSAQVAAAASAEPAVSISQAPSGSASVETDGGSVRIAADGDITLDPASAPPIVIALGASADDVEFVDGAVVASDVAPSVDMVTRATEGGVQVIAVLADETAGSEIVFPVDLPEGARMVAQADGSVSVMASVATEEATPQEMDRIATEVEAIVGDLEADAEITDSQWEQLAQIAPAETVTTVAEQVIATIDTPWAVDANGQPIPTHYEITAEGITQVVETDTNTDFPVTADPAWWWWGATGAACLAQVGGFLFSAAKLAGIVAKADKIIRSSVTLTNIVKKLGGWAQTLSAMYYMTKGKLAGSITKYVSATKVAQVKDLVSRAGGLIGDALGIGSCISIVRNL